MEIATLPAEIQIVLVAGYLAYRAFVTGRGVLHDTTDTALQILTFGSVGRLFAALVGLAFEPAATVLSSENTTILTAVLTAFFAIAIAALSRRFGLTAASQLMRLLGVYRDDHQYSAWASIMAVPARWNYIQLQLNDGRTIESNFNQLVVHPPGDRLTVNNDGFAMYITAIYDSNNVRKDVDPRNGAAHIVSYIPRSLVSQIDIGWQDA